MKKYLLALFAALVLSLAPTPAKAQSEDAGLIATMIQAGMTCNPCLQSCLAGIYFPYSQLEMIGAVYPEFYAWWVETFWTIDDLMWFIW
jgi:hypothetical protein